MEIILYDTNDELNRVVKTVINGVAYSNGVMREGSSVTNPVFRIESATFINKNYAKITEFGRYYYIKKITAVRNNLYELELAVDVLMSYSAKIKSLKCVIGRQQGAFNMYLDDPEFKALNVMRVQTKTFPNGFNDTPQFILTVAGGQ